MFPIVVRRSILSLGIALSCLCSAGPAHHKLKLQCKDQQGLPVPAAKISVRHVVTGAEASCISNSDGICLVELHQSGNYLVRAGDGNLHVDQTLHVTGKDQTATLDMRPALLQQSVTVLSGSRTEELQEESATKVEAVTRTAMESTGYERVSDVLQEIPGVLVRRGNTASVGGEQVQGIDSRQVLVLQDGLPVAGARGIKSGVVNLNRQSASRLSRVEVAKGTSSALYGSDAIGGVINMITREPKERLEGGLLLSGGSLGMLDARGDIGTRLGRASLYLNGGTHHLDSYRLIPNSPTTVGPQIRREDILFKARVHLTPMFFLGFTANGYRNREEGRNASETGLVDGLTRDSTQSHALVGDWVLDPATTLQARGYVSHYDEDSLTTALAPPGAVPVAANLNERLSRLDATLSRQFSHGHFLQGGVEWAQNLYRGINRVAGDNVGQQITARDFWLQDRWQTGGSGRRLTITAGGRITNHSLFGGAAVPKIGAIYRLTGSLIARASFGMGFRAPDLGQLYYRFANPGSFYQVIGNPNLNPEYSQSWQTGLTLRRSRYRAGLTLFHNNVRDLIDSRLIGTPRTSAELQAVLAPYGIPPMFAPLLNRQLFIYVNQSRIFARGIELDGEYAFTRTLRVSGSYTFLNAKDRITGLGLAQRHRHNGALRFDYTIPRLGIHTNVRGVFYGNWLLNAAAGTRGLPFQIWDVYAGKNWRRGIETFLAIDNFNDSRDGKLQLATPTFDRPDYGRTYRVGLRYRFGARE